LRVHEVGAGFDVCNLRVNGRAVVMNLHVA
jgi:hypothetical protein